MRYLKSKRRESECYRLVTIGIERIMLGRHLYVEINVSISLLWSLFGRNYQERNQYREFAKKRKYGKEGNRNPQGKLQL